jgi:hypothetical protein
MNKDKLIAIGLIVAFVFLFIALVGVIAITGFVVFFMDSENKNQTTEIKPITDETPIIDKINQEENIKSNNEPKEKKQEEQTQTENKNKATAPICGDGKKDDSEQCETDSDCSTNQICKNCNCEPKPEPTATKLENIKIESLVFFCAPNFNGKQGLAIKIINMKNTGTTDFSYTKTLTLKSEIGEITDSVQTKNSYKFTVKAGKPIEIYQKDMAREQAPYLFIGNSPGKLKLTIWLDKTQYIEYLYDLKATDFAKAGCL